MATSSSSERLLWLVSRRTDFWLASAGASLGLLMSLLVIVWYGDQELDWLDFVLSEFHLGATYDAIIRRRLWRHRPGDVVLVPLLILALTYALVLSDQAILLTSIAMYAAVWHRGRQSLGVARFYQRGIGGPVSRVHALLFRGAIYLPMVAGVLAYTYLAPTDYEGEPYLALGCGASMTALAAWAATAWVSAYLAYTLWRTRGGWLGAMPQTAGIAVHPGEWWVVLAHAVAFGSGYALGASHASFLLILVVHHEVQYLYFTYAMARHRGSFSGVRQTDTDLARKALAAQISSKDRGTLRTEVGYATSFFVWPVIGFVGAMVGGWSQLEWLAPLGVGGLFCHYWLDGRIWTRQSWQN